MAKNTNPDNAIAEVLLPSRHNSKPSETGWTTLNSSKGKSPSETCLINKHKNNEHVQGNHPPVPQALRRDPYHRGRAHDEEPRQTNIDHKLTTPTYAGRVNSESYLDWEKREENIFELYGYLDHKKVSFVVAQLTENALAWWDRDVAERRRMRHR